MHETPKWHFRTIGNDQKHVEPTHREHLAPGGVVEPLVRESIQNSLDVPLQGLPTRMVFRVGYVPASEVKPYFEELQPHLTAITGSLPEGVPGTVGSLKYLAIEDFNTTGLEGDPSRRKPTNADGTKNHFFRFWHSVGQSAGDFKRRGSWGVGKVVFSNASQIRTFFGLTLRVNETDALLMGEAGLTIHSLPGDENIYDWYGYYAIHREGPLPIQDKESVAEFCRVFSLNRTTSGLSIVVPYLREEVTISELARCVIEQYFLPILAGRLEVVVESGAEKIEIKQSTIEEAVNKVSWPSRGMPEEITKLLEIARWQSGLKSEEYAQLNEIGADGAYALTGQTFPENMLRRLSDEFAVKRRVAVKIPVRIRAKSGAVQTDEVRLVLEHDDKLRVSNVPHLRSGLNISKMRDKGGPGARGILLVGSDPDQGELDKLLQASEGPAHVNWEQRGEGYDKAKSLYDDAFKVIGLMRHLVRGFVEFLSTPPDSQDTKTLSMFFPDYEALGDSVGEGPGKGRGKRPKPGRKEPDPPTWPTKGVIEGVVRSLFPTVRGLRPVEGASVQLNGLNAEVNQSTLTDSDGKFRFADLAPSDYQLVAEKAEIGRAQKSVTIPAEHGAYVELLLRREQAPRAFFKVPLDDGFAIRGNPQFEGALRPIRVRLAYAAWGGSKSYTEYDFSLFDDALSLEFSGIRETAREQLIMAPNVLTFTPENVQFYVEVRGFDPNRALYADARTLEEEAISDEVSA